jgi:hypothetical protein
MDKIKHIKIDKDENRICNNEVKIINTINKYRYNEVLI